MGLTQVSTDGVKDASLLNADINASAAIARTKLANVDLVDDTSPELGGGLASNGFNINFADSNGSNNSAKFGASGDLTIYHDSVHSRIVDSGTGDLKLQSSKVTIGNAGNSETMAAFTENGAVELYFDNTLRFLTNSIGAQCQGDFSIPLDNEQLRIGASNDIRMYHDGSHSFLTNQTGAFFIAADDLRLTNAATNEPYIKCIANGAVELYHDNSKKFETTSDGVAITTNSSQTTRTSENTVLIKNTNNSANTCASLHLQASGSSPNIYKISTQKHSGGSGAEFHLDVGTNARMQMSGDHGDIKFGVGGTMINTFTPGLGNNTVGLGLEPRNGSIFLSRSDGAALYINTNTDGAQLATFRRNGNEQGKIIAHSSSVSYETTSDYRLKENAVAISDGITRLKQLKPYKFNFKSNSSETLDGFFAHEAQTVVPECASGTKDQVVVQAQVDSEVYKEEELGNPIYQGIDQSKLVPLLVAAVQELIGKVEALEAA